MERRIREYGNLERAIKSGSFEQCPIICFKMLFGLSPELHFRLVCSKMNEYLSIFEKRFPEVKWPRLLLDAPIDYVSKYGRRIPENPEAANKADEIFLLCFHALVLAYAYIGHNSIVSTSFICALENSVRALSLNAWIEKAPMEYQTFLRSDGDSKNRLLDNDLFHGIEKQEWRAVALWFEQNNLLDMPDNVNVEKMEKTLKYWKDGEYSLIVPETRKLMEKDRNDLEISIFDIL